MTALNTHNVLGALSHHIGASNGVHADVLVQEITGEPSHPITERKLRAMVTALRLEGFHICAHPHNGYYVAATPEELDATCAFLYERALASLTQIAAMKRIALPDLRGQLHLPT